MMTRTNPNHLMSAQEAVAAAFTDAGVSVAWDATTPWADLERKVVHLRPIPDRLSEEEIEDVRGDCDHELGHIKFTNPAALSATNRVMVRSIANSIEDGRVDRLMAQEWFGCGENLERSADRAVARIVAGNCVDELGRRARALCGLSLIAFGRSPKLVIVELGEDIRPLYEPVTDLLTKVSNCQSTDDSVTVATELADRWGWRPIAVDHKKIKLPPEDAAANEISNLSTSVASERKSAVGKLTPSSVNTYRPLTVNDRDEGIRKPSFELNRLFGPFYEGIHKVVPTLRRRLLMEFRSSGKKAARHLKTGKLDERSLFRVALDDPRVYRADRRALVHRSTVTLLVDCSASMTHPGRMEPAYPGEPSVFRTKLFIAAQAAAAVSLTLDLLRIPNECLAFTTVRSPVAARSDFERVRPVRHLTVKPFNKRAHACRGNFVSLGLYEHCSENIDGEAILWASKRLLTKPKGGDSPVLIVFSDGEPASQPEDAGVLAQHLRHAIKQAEMAGVAVFGVGIGSDAVKHFYKNTVVVDDVSNLVADFYELLRKVLRERLALSA